MDLIFDNDALAFFRVLGYNCFCARRVDTTIHFPRMKTCTYCELIPFKNTYDAMEFYFDHGKYDPACHIVIDEEVIEDIASGKHGMTVYVKGVENVFS